MKKTNQQTQKKLSLKKLQLVKIKTMKTIIGGGVAQDLYFNTAGDEPTPRPKTFDTKK